MNNLNYIMMNRIEMGENKRRKEILQCELERISRMEKERKTYCRHDYVLFYGKDHEPALECFGCGEMDFDFSNNIPLSRKLEILENSGIKIIDVSKYVEKVGREKLLSLIELELRSMIDTKECDFNRVITGVIGKVKNSKKE